MSLKYKKIKNLIFIGCYRPGLNLFVKLHPHIKKEVCFESTDEYIIIPRSIKGNFEIIF
jgi:hypothetical protein